MRMYCSKRPKSSSLEEFSNEIRFAAFHFDFSKLRATENMVFAEGTRNQ